MITSGLGRRPPSDWRHVERYGFASPVPSQAERILLPPDYRVHYDQGVEGACVGFAGSWMMSILNRRRYDPWWLYEMAQEVDEWPGTDYEGTSIRAGFDVLRDAGHRRIYRGVIKPPDVTDGIAENRWATTVDDVRAAISGGSPVVLGVNWYSTFSTPVMRSSRWWIGENLDWGSVRGGHAVCAHGVSDRLQAICFVNSWGRDYPGRVWLSYETLARLMGEDGEVGLVTDR